MEHHVTISTHRAGKSAFAKCECGWKAQATSKINVSSSIQHVSYLWAKHLANSDDK